MTSETTPLRGVQYASDAQRRKRIVGITGVVVVLTAVIVVLWLTLSGHSSRSTDVTVPRTPEPVPAAEPSTHDNPHAFRDVDAVQHGNPPVDAVHHGNPPVDAVQHENPPVDAVQHGKSL
uniref:Uncharacterized protein n=1 Tax=Peronospora matthiolae TaxID=2874970 RepID=A0AAV1V371_9STRA